MPLRWTAWGELDRADDPVLRPDQGRSTRGRAEHRVANLLAEGALQDAAVAAPIVRRRSPEVELLLEVDGITKRFGGLPAVDGVTFGIDDGDIVAVVGPNGAGKSTLLKVDRRARAADRGSIRLDGSRIDSLAAHRVRRKGIAMAAQRPLPFGSMTVLENVALGAMFGVEHGVVGEREARRRAADALAFVELQERADQPVSSLNLHQLRFLELAKALAGKPRVLLLDEVMAGLNESEARQPRSGSSETSVTSSASRSSGSST